MKLRVYIQACLKKHALAPTAALIGGLSLLSAAPAVTASDLVEVYQKALQNDPLIREADANRLASRESKPQALSALGAGGNTHVHRAVESRDGDFAAQRRLPWGHG